MSVNDLEPELGYVSKTWKGNQLRYRISNMQLNVFKELSEKSRMRLMPYR